MEPNQAPKREPNRFHFWCQNKIMYAESGDPWMQTNSRSVPKMEPNRFPILAPFSHKKMPLELKFGTILQPMCPMKHLQGQICLLEMWNDHAEISIKITHINY